MCRNLSEWPVCVCGTTNKASATTFKRSVLIRLMVNTKRCECCLVATSSFKINARYKRKDVAGRRPMLRTLFKTAICRGRKTKRKSLRRSHLVTLHPFRKDRRKALAPTCWTKPEGRLPLSSLRRAWSLPLSTKQQPHSPSSQS